MTALALPNISDAKLPKAYEHAKNALATCSEIDECKEWADKAAALASYAKQAQDETLEKTSMRIRARAIQRCGELLKAIEAGRAGRPPEKSTPAPTQISRSKAARDAGMSQRQKETALRVANVDRDEFERDVESDDPPTVTALAERGTDKKPSTISITDQAAMMAEGAIARLFAEARAVAPARVPTQATAAGRDRLAEQVPFLLGWLSDVNRYLEK